MRYDPRVSLSISSIRALARNPSMTIRCRESPLSMHRSNTLTIAHRPGHGWSWPDYQHCPDCQGGYQKPCSLAPMHMRISTFARLSNGRLPIAIYHGSPPCDNRRCPENRGGSSTITGNRSRTTRPFADKHGNVFVGPLIMPIVKIVSRFLVFSSSYLRARGGATRRHSRKASWLGPHNIDAGVSKDT